MGKIRSFFAKLNNASPAAKASFWFVVSNVCLKGISFITTPIFTRLLTIEDYGATGVFVTWEGIISIFATLSLAGGVYNIAQTKYGDDINAYTSSMMSLTFIFSALTYSVCIIINTLFPSIFELDNAFLIFMWVQTFTNAAVSFWLMRRRFVYDYKSVIAYTFANSLLSPTIAIVAIILFPNNAAYAKVVGAGVVGIVIGVILTISFCFRGKRLYSGKYWKHALRFNLPLIPHYLTGTIASSSDRLMIDAMVGRAEVGISTIAHSITGLMSLVTQAINASLIPYTMQCIRDNNVKGLKKTINVCMILVGAICVFIMMFAKEGVLIFATKDYIEAVKFIPPLTAGVLFYFAYGILGNIMYCHEKTWGMSAITITCAVFNIVGNFIGIKLFGYVATAYTTMLSYALQMLLCYFLLRKYQKNLNEIIDLRFVFLLFAVYSLFMAYSIVFYNLFWARLGLVLLIIVCLILFKNKIVTIFKSMKKREGQLSTEIKDAK